MINLDGSLGEGGGQVLRSALSLSIITGQPFTIFNIRAGRKQPGLMAQHLKSVDAAAAISKGEVNDAFLGSTNLTFRPNGIRSGRYKLDIQTAGSTSLVFQTIYLPLSLASSASHFIINGGTHVPWSPCYHYLEMHWMKILRSLGFDGSLTLDHAGFYPQGAGRISATIRPVGEIKPLALLDRGALCRIHGISAVANLSKDIAERQKRQAVNRLLQFTNDIRIKAIDLPAKFKGTVLLLVAEFDLANCNDYTQCCYFSLGERGKPAERVANEAVDAFQRFLQTDGTVDEYLADQILLPLTFAAAISEFRTAKITPHLLTNAEIIRKFTSAEIHIQGRLNDTGYVRVTPTVLPRNADASQNSTH